jgi:hypothetical protein
MAKPDIHIFFPAKHAYIGLDRRNILFGAQSRVTPERETQEPEDRRCPPSLSFRRRNHFGRERFILKRAVAIIGGILYTLKPFAAGSSPKTDAIGKRKQQRYCHESYEIFDFF